MIKEKNTKQTEKAETSNFKGFPMVYVNLIFNLGLDQHRKQDINCVVGGPKLTIIEYQKNEMTTLFLSFFLPKLGQICVSA